MSNIVQDTAEKSSKGQTQLSPALNSTLHQAITSLHSCVLQTFTECTPRASYGELKDLASVPDISYEQGALGMTNFASECSGRLGSLLGE